jgi:PAS domain S-box-containing protein
MDAIIAVDTQHRIVVFNPAAEKMFECSAQNALGTAINRFIPERYRLAHAGHINDFAASGRTNSAVAGRTDLWALRANGQEFPIETSISQMEADGKKLFAVVLRDITQRKMAEEALSSVSRRLIEAHEEERTWIARELHDDVNQRLALLAGTLDILKSELPPGANEAKHYLADLKEQTKELAADVQALSHRLHSSKLEYLGLASAAAAFCREFSESKGVQIDFQSDDVPRSLPKEISLCLFRVMQEALQNASKHSGSEHYNVFLVRTSEEIRLTVSDFGRGFDPEAALRSAGLGITSMRERLTLVAGEFTIESRSQFGTTVQARVPLAPKAKEARAGAGASPDDGYKEAMVPTGD